MKNVLYRNKIWDYTITENDEVYNLNGKRLKTRHNNRGYVILDLYYNKSKYTVLLHRLVAETYIPNPHNLPVVNHRDGNKDECVVTNLEWCTYSYNNLHAYDNGLHESLKGVDSPFAKYSEDTIRVICKALTKVESPMQVAKLLGVPLSLVRSIKSGESWCNISKEYDIPPCRFYMDATTYLKITDMYAAGIRMKDICKTLGWPLEPLYFKRIRRAIVKYKQNVQRLS